VFRLPAALRLESGMFRDAANDWSSHNAPRLGAALAYYAVLSLAPLFLIVMAVAGYFVNENAARGQIYWQVRSIAGSQTAEVVQTLLRGAHEKNRGIMATCLGFVLLLLGASGIFVELRDTLNYIWDAPAVPSGGIASVIRYRLFAFAAVAGIGVLVICSLIASIWVQALGKDVTLFISVPGPALEAVNFGITFAVMSFLFALIYRIFPAIPVEWEDVAVGSVVTAALFAVGKFVVGLYLGRAGVGSAYGAAGSLVVLLVWIYYSAQIFLYGAEFTHVFATYRKKSRESER